MNSSVAEAYLGVYLSLLEDAGINNADNDQTSDDQSESNEGYEEDTASAGREFAPYDPVLDSCVSKRTSMAPATFQTVSLTYLALKVPSPSDKQD